MTLPLNICHNSAVGFMLNLTKLGYLSCRSLRRCSSSVILLLVLGAFGSVRGQGQSPPQLSETYDALPLQFERNVGQFAPDVQAVARNGRYSVRLSDGVAKVRLRKQAAETSLEVKPVGGNPSPAFSVTDALPGKVNYFIGSDASRWLTNVPTARKVKYSSIYPGIDLTYYGNQQQLEFDFVVQAGADPAELKLQFAGARKLSVDKEGNLRVELPGGELVERRPVAYQEVGGKRQPVDARYIVRDSLVPEVTFALGRYDKDQPLVIDPVLVYSTFLGGTGNDRAVAIAIDNSGSAYIAGRTNSTDLPTSSSAFQPKSTLTDVFRTTDAAASWSAAGGGLPNMIVSSIVVDPHAANMVYVASEGTSDIPPQGIFKSTDAGANWQPIDTGLTSNDIAQLAIDPANSSTLYAVTGHLIFKSTDGGTHWSSSSNGIPTDFTITCIAIDPTATSILYAGAAGSVYKSTDGGANWTSLSSIGTGVRAIVIDPTNHTTIYVGANASAFGGPGGGVFKSTDGGASFNATSLNGGFPFGFKALAIDPTNPSVLYESDVSIPSSTSGQVSELQTSTDGGATWNVLQTGNNDEPVNALVVAPTNPSKLYVATTKNGVQTSTDGGATFTPSTLPLGDITALGIDPGNPNSVYAGTRGIFGVPPNSSFDFGPTQLVDNAFVAKLAPDGSSFAYVTYLAGVGTSSATGIAVDGSGSAYLTGITVTGSFPTTSGAFQATPPANSSAAAFVTKLTPDGSGLAYSTYLGGTSPKNEPDQGHAIAVDGAGNAYICGSTVANDFPTTPSGYQTSGPGAFVTELNAQGTQLLYSTTLGERSDSAEAIALDGSGNIYLAGSAYFGFPITGNAYQGTIGAGPGAFFAKVDPTKSGAASLVYSTYLNSGGASIGYGVAVDGTGKAYVTGNTTASDFPVRNGFQATYGGANQNTSDSTGDAFVTSIDPAATGDASLVYSSFLGGAKDEVGYAVTVNSSGSYCVVTGSTFSSDFPIKNSLQPFLGFQNAFVTAVDTSATGAASLLYSTLLGGSNDNAEGHGITHDNSGNVYLAGFSGAADFPVTQSAQPVQAGSNDAFVVKLSNASTLADLSVTISGQPDPVEQGANITYTITVTNNGPNDAANAVANVLLDPASTFVSASIAPAAKTAGQIQFQLGPLSNGAQMQFQVVAQVGSPSDVQQPGVTAAATVHSSDADPDVTNNRASATNGVNLHIANLKITAASVPNPTVQGQDFHQQFAVTNAGPDAATGVVVQVTVDSQLIFVSALPAPADVSGQTVTISLPGSLASGASTTVDVTVHPNIPTGTVESTGTVQASEVDPDTSDNKTYLDSTITTPDTADISVQLIGPDSPAPVGDLTYTLKVTNNGPHFATNVVVTDAFTAGTPITSVNAPAGVTVNTSNSVVTLTIAELDVGVTDTITITVSAPTDARLNSTVTVTANEKDAISFNNDLSLYTTVRNGSVQFLVVNTQDSGPGSFRQAILDSEATESSAAVPNKVIFNIPETDAGRDANTGVFTIVPLSKFPGINHPVIIDGYTQPGAQPNTNGPGQPDNARILIELTGIQAGRPTNGLAVFGDHCTIRGLAINRYVTLLQRGPRQNLLFDGDGILLEASNCVVEGCFIGVDPSGIVARGNEVGGVINFGSNNRVGGTDPAQRNVISGNGAAGVASASVQSGNVYLNNFVGTDASGSVGLPTNLLNVAGLSLSSDGLLIEGVRETIGGTKPEARNILSGNNGAGLRILQVSGASPGSSAENEVVQGNFIGTDVTGTKAVPNAAGGVVVFGFNNTIGGKTTAERNIISGNYGHGVDITDSGNMVVGNLIGTDVTGTQPVANDTGVYIQGPANIIGGPDAGVGNVIAGNNNSGVAIQNDGTVIQGNSIGVDANGDALGNGGDGVSIIGSLLSQNENFDGSGNNVSGNQIAFNGLSGVSVTSTAPFSGTGNDISGNHIDQNRRLGIDLLAVSDPANGVTPNHGTDVVIGPNHDQNYPVLSSADGTGNSTSVSGALDSYPGTSFTIDFYASAGCDPSGNGEGQAPVGSLQVTTDSSGHLAFNTSLSQNLGGQVLTATARTGNPDFGIAGTDTSEFSPCILITGGTPNPPPARTAELELAGSASPAPATANNSLSYAFTVTNHGPDVAPTVLFTDVLPGSVSFMSAQASQGNATAQNGTVSCNFGNLASGSSATVTIVVMPFAEGNVSNTGIVQSNATDPMPDDNSVTLTTQVNPGSPTTDLVIGQEATPAPVKLGAEVVYTITVTNAGARNATGVTISDTLPDTVTYLSDDSSQGWAQAGHTLSLFYGALAAGDTIKAFVAVTTNQAGTISNTVSVSENESDLTPGNNSSTLQVSVLKAPSVTVLTSAPSASDPGQVTYTASVTSTTSGAPGGNVLFKQGDKVLATVPLDKSGKATFTTAPPDPRSAPIVAVYQGDSNFLPSSSAGGVQVSSRLLNISTRMEVLTDDNVLIAGFIVTGNDTKKVILRAIGPSLPVTGPLADPTLELHDANGIIATNDNWKINDANGQSQEADITATGIPPSNDLESALLAELPANNAAYTAIMRGNGGGTGIGLVEVYDLNQAVNSQLANISTRGFIDTGDNVMIGGFIAGPGNAGSARVLIRAIGPSLPVQAALADPTLELHDVNGGVIATNDNWKTDDASGQSQEATIAATGIPPTNDLESALIQVVAPGNYTAIVRGKDNSTGVGLVELYNLQ